MQLSKIIIKNYRLLINADLEVDPKTTLIVGRNNTAKTSCFECIGKALTGSPFSFNDYPLSKRKNLYANIASFMAKKITFENLCERLEPISIEFLVDYSLDDPEDNLGALSPFISMSPSDKTRRRCHIEFQTEENGLCGHSLEEAIRNVNRSYYELGSNPTEDELEFLGKSKTDFALDLICKCKDYAVPAYIKDGLVWLNDQQVLE